MQRLRGVVAFLACLVGATAATAQPQSCTPLAQTTFVRDTMQELYLWYRDVPDLDPARFDSPESYLASARSRPLDATFSYIASRAADEAFFSASQFVGLGLTTAVRDGVVRVLQVFPGSPAAEAGLDRGSRIDAIDGRATAELVATGAIDGAFGRAEVGLPVALSFVTRDGTARVLTIRKREVTIPTVSLGRVLDVGGRRVGYVFFRNFVRPSVAALDEAFAELARARVDELVLDLRYNGGGLVDVAQHLAGLIAGEPVVDQIFAASEHNDRNRRLNDVIRFTRPASVVTLSRLVVLTTRASASASELLINGLRPFLPVIVVGERTLGKPVGQYGLPFCDKVFAPVAFAMTNARGEGGYFEGLAPTCAAPDDLDHDLGTPNEASLAAALAYVATGACPSPTPRLGVNRAGFVHAPATGWQSVVNAH